MFEFDEYGRPKWPPEDPILKTLEQQTAPAPESDPSAAEPAGPHIYGGNRARSTNPILAEMGVNTEGPLADEAAQRAQNYDPGTYEEGGTSRYMPQQYGQPGTPYNPDEGPLSPQETAARMPQTAGGMEELIRKHMLPMNPALKAMSPEARQQFLARKREQDDAQRMQRRQMQGGMNGFVGQTMPSVHNIGGFTFVQGNWRPADPMERAKINATNAQARYMDARPEIEQAKVQGLFDRQEDRFKHENELSKTRADAAANVATIKAGAAKDKETLIQQSKDQQTAYQARTRFNELVQQIRDAEGRAQRLAKENSRGMFNPMRLITGNPTPEQYLDYFPDRKGNVAPKSGSYRSAVDELLRMNEILGNFYEKGIKTGEYSDDIHDLVERLKYQTGRTQEPNLR